MELADAFKVIKAGPLASLQDAGRFGVRHLGITQGGAVDLHAWAWGNYLAGNAWGAAALEVTLGSLSLEATTDLSLALTGADLGTTVDGDSIQNWAAFQVRAGQVLAFASPRNGLRAYLSVAGGFQAEPVLGSLSGVAREKLGGHYGDGRQLAVGDVLRFNHEAYGAHPETRQAPETEKIDYAQPAVLNLVLGAQVGEFSGRSLFDFFNRSWAVDNRSDRMGVRLKGPLLKCAINNMISEGLALGAVQVPPDGQPIVLLNDRQTIGGYPRLGTLTPLSCSRLAQCKPGQKVTFRPVAPERAHLQYLEFLAQIAHP
ncbi:biotin-dependent carboxyltransferase family protein [Marinobacter sp.]|uniref:5-oxoprolinase subunit C family protein n=1 Tax=Marinobacter sp. TaxID=50741 RepID=UPI0025C0E7E9|nr:biotin-dependent carboxyltransferase family protein [Marinobacter sp.]